MFVRFFLQTNRMYKFDKQITFIFSEQPGEGLITFIHIFFIQPIVNRL